MGTSRSPNGPSPHVLTRTHLLGRLHQHVPQRPQWRRVSRRGDHLPVRHFYPLKSSSVQIWRLHSFSQVPRTRDCRSPWVDRTRSLGNCNTGRLLRLPLAQARCTYLFLPPLPPLLPSSLPPSLPSSLLPSFRFYSERAPDPESIHAEQQKAPRIIAVPIRTALPYRSQYTNSISLPPSRDPNHGLNRLYVESWNRRTMLPFSVLYLSNKLQMHMYISTIESLECLGMFLDCF